MKQIHTVFTGMVFCFFVISLLSMGGILQASFSSSLPKIVQEYEGTVYTFLHIADSFFVLEGDDLVSSISESMDVSSMIPAYSFLEPLFSTLALTVIAFLLVVVCVGLCVNIPFAIILSRYKSDALVLLFSFHSPSIKMYGLY